MTNDLTDKFHRALASAAEKYHGETAGNWGPDFEQGAQWAMSFILDYDNYKELHTKFAIFPTKLSDGKYVWLREYKVLLRSIFDSRLEGWHMVEVKRTTD